MYFNKFPYRSNFEYLCDGQISRGAGSVKGLFEAADFKPNSPNPNSTQAITISCECYEGGIYYLKVNSEKWSVNYTQSELSFPPHVNGGGTTLDIDEQCNLNLKDASGEVLLSSVSDKGFGVCGNESIFTFKRNESDRYYGMGEKMFGLEQSGRKTKFWNTDVFGDFDWNHITVGQPDPLYVSVPYIIIKRGAHYLGILIDNPYATFIDTCGKINISNQMDTDTQPIETLALGAEHGQPNLVIIYGPTLAELTQKLQQIVGITPLPPVWALGYHQCRWGYESYADLKYLNAAMDKFEIPCDGLWLDIEYMRGYRVFTFEEKNNFPDLKKNLQDIQSNGRRVVPIIDPGVKSEKGYDVYESGLKEDIFCKNPQGQNFIGLVWPGETVFPDYSTDVGRSWWAKLVTEFAQTGITAAWLDMNDPSVGSALCTDMLFDHGKNSHYTFHNQYALGMSRATRDGFSLAYPNERPFLLSRSGFTGSSKYAAIWTGDNISSYHYLRTSIPCSLNLALSGIPFNGPDMGGFDGNAEPELMIDWFKTGFLFPFFRNHCVKGGEDQEPWTFDHKTLDILRHYIRMRYYLRPYLYNLFVLHEETGDAIMRPLFYEFNDTGKQELGYITDQFMIGPSIMQAPFVEEDKEHREVTLPDSVWYSVIDHQWITGNEVITVEKYDYTTPIYFRQGSIIPMAKEVIGDHVYKFNDIRFHLLFNNSHDVSSEYNYTFDDGQTYDYKKGKRSRLKVTAKVNHGDLIITTDLTENGYGKCCFDFAIYDHFTKVTLNGKPIIPELLKMTLAGRELHLGLVKES